MMQWKLSWNRAPLVSLDVVKERPRKRPPSPVLHSLACLNYLLSCVVFGPISSTASSNRFGDPQWHEGQARGSCKGTGEAASQKGTVQRVTTVSCECVHEILGRMIWENIFHYLGMGNLPIAYIIPWYWGVLIWNNWSSAHLESPSLPIWQNYFCVCVWMKMWVTQEEWWAVGLGHVKKKCVFFMPANLWNLLSSELNYPRMNFKTISLNNRTIKETPEIN